MGAKLVRAAYAAAQEHSLREHAPMRLFVFMALTAVDDHSQPQFWKRREDLADALAAPRSAGGYKLVRQAVATLVARGFLELQNHPAPGSPARYALLDGAGRALRPAGDGAPSDSPVSETEPPQGAVNNSERGTLRGSTGHPQGFDGAPSDSPRGEEEKQEEGAPSRFCDRHPNGTSAPCGPCGDARKRADAWRPPKRSARPHTHRFDPVSGYCDGCGRREDAA